MWRTFGLICYGLGAASAFAALGVHLSEEATRNRGRNFWSRKHPTRSGLYLAAWVPALLIGGHILESAETRQQQETEKHPGQRLQSMFDRVSERAGEHVSNRQPAGTRS